jgi:hypothetical protein
MMLGIGGTMVRLAVRASHQCPTQDEIATPKKLLELTKSNSSGISFCNARQKSVDTQIR